MIDVSVPMIHTESPVQFCRDMPIGVTCIICIIC